MVEAHATAFNRMETLLSNHVVVTIKDCQGQTVALQFTPLLYDCSTTSPLG